MGRLAVLVGGLRRGARDDDGEGEGRGGRDALLFPNVICKLRVAALFPVARSLDVSPRARADGVVAAGTQTTPRMFGWFRGGTLPTKELRLTRHHGTMR